ncbi:MAG: hypothetical protein Q7S66_00490 [bacterium]|nr:hypothetical protein [bacterium]
MTKNFDLEQQTPEPNRKVIGIIIFSFLLTFVVARLFVYSVVGHWLPDFFLNVRGVHIHHFAYGVMIIAAVGLYFIVKRPDPGTHTFLHACFLYGIGLGLTFDEFGMWIRLEDDYWVRQSYDAVVIILLVLLNIAFFKSIVAWIRKEWRELIGK